MSPGDVVVVSLSSPREKFWGVMLTLESVGVSIRGLALETFEDWLRQNATESALLLGAVTVFFPAHRIERIELDETSGVVEGLSARFRRITGRDAKEALLVV